MVHNKLGAHVHPALKVLELHIPEPLKFGKLKYLLELIPPTSCFFIPIIAP